MTLDSWDGASIRKEIIVGYWIEICTSEQLPKEYKELDYPYP